ncbi:MAG: hypothetical protein O3A82_06995 [Verrucomicrobia bacterium]|nr:hypothetical protein [Verrucomicrobiota bacterium]MDA1046657.1 hypothetical protein [Verrucomicrobiota bacterium]
MASPHGRGNPIEVVKRVSLSGNLAPVASWLAGSEEANAGWRNSSWFGSFYKTSTPWLYHEELGRIYAQDDGHGGVWLWHESQGWLWTNPNSYRYLYQADASHWLYFLKRKDGPARFYNYATSKVE